jgi:hypothetical protein
MEFYQSRTGFTALLGLWQETLQTDLTWFRRPSTGEMEEVEPQDELYEFPSWTYLPLMCTPGFNMGWRADAYLNLQPFKVVSAKVEWEEQPFTSKLKSSHLSVSGLVKEAYIGTSDIQSVRPAAPSSSGAELPECGEFRLYDESNRQVAAFYPDFRYAREWEMRLSTPKLRLPVKVLCLYRDQHYDESEDVGLVLQAVENDSSRYRRLGVAKGWSGQIAEWLHLDEEFFETFDGEEDMTTCSLI